MKKKIAVVIILLFVITGSIIAVSGVGSLNDIWRSFGIKQAAIKASDTNENVAEVNGVAITKSSLELAKSTQIISSKKQTDKEYLDAIISKEVLYQDASKNGISVTSDEINKFIEDQAYSTRVNQDLFDQMKQFWQGMNVTEEEYYKISTPTYVKFIVIGKYKLILQNKYSEAHQNEDVQQVKNDFKKEYDVYKSNLLKNADIVYYN